MTSTHTLVANKALSGHTYNHKDAVASTITNYTPAMIPRARWASVAEFTRSAATDFAPRNVVEARNVLFGIARLADWTRHVAGHPLDRRIVLDPRNIDDYVKRGYPVAAAGRKTLVRQYLHLVSAELGFGDEARRRARHHQPLDQHEPYTALELSDFRLSGRTASTAMRKQVWSAVLALGAGFALTTSEIFDARPGDLTIDARGLVLSVSGGTPREVVCLPEWESEITTIFEERVTKELVLDIAANPNRSVRARSTYLAKFLDNAAGTQQKKFVVGRLRTTWIARHLEERTPVQAIMRALGVSTTRPIDRCLKHVRPMGDSEYFNALQLGVDR